MTRVTFSENKISFEIPKGWHELTQEELAAVIEVVGTCRDTVAPLGVFCRLTGMKIVRETPEGFLCYVRIAGKDVRFLAKPEQMHDVLIPLDWLYDPGTVPVRPDTLRGVPAVDAQFHGVSFADWLAIDNSYLGFLTSKAPAALNPIAARLYPGISLDKQLTDAEVFVLVNWVTQVKGMFSAMFTHFFKSDGSGGAIDAKAAREIMDNEIRALTGGDVTKEQVVFATDVWRALTELDHKAREAEEFKAQMAKYK